MYLTKDNIDHKADEWITAIHKVIWPRDQFHLDIPRCGLLVIDMLNYFAHPQGRAYLPATAAVSSRIAKLIELWRQSQAPVIFTRHCHEGEHDLGMLGKFWSDYIHCGELEAEIISELCPQPNEPIIRKTTYDAFYNTELETYLNTHKVEQVLVTGVLTQMCCETTARSAFVRGYEVYLPVDATATSAETFHFNSLLSLASAVAILLKTDEIISLGSTPSSDGEAE